MMISVITICITLIIIVSIICYTKYKLSGIDYYKRYLSNLQTIEEKISKNNKLLDELLNLLNIR